MALHLAMDASPWGVVFRSRSGDPASDSSHGKDLILQRGRCDSMVYVDGLFWWSKDVPRILVPEKDQKAVPSGAFFKLLEIKERYNFDNLHNPTCLRLAIVGRRKDSKIALVEVPGQRKPLHVLLGPARVS